MPLALEPGRVGIDIAHVPVGIGRDLRIAASAVVVDARHHPVIAVVEADIEGVDLIGLQRHIKVLGIFARLWYRDGKAGYLADLPLTLEYVRDTAGRYAELASFACAIEESLATPLRRGEPPVVGIVRDGKLLLDCLTLADAEVDEVAAAVSACR